MERLKQYAWQMILGMALLLIVLFAFHNAGAYKTTIGKVVKVQTEETGSATNYNSASENASEPTYTQKLTVKVLNGTYKGKKITVKNSYEYSLIDTEKCRRGDQVFLNISGEGEISSATVSGIKRDQYGILLLALLVYLVLILAGKRGIFALVSLAINIGIFVFALIMYENGADLIRLCNIMIVIFTVCTLFIVNGVNKRTMIAIAATFMTTFISIALFRIVLEYGGDIDYANLDYITGGQDLETIFIASISIAGLGAIMDVSVSISSALNELVVKDPNVSFRQMIRSGRELGYDIMGTMINVLLFTYICGLMPLMIIKIKNQIRLFTIIRIQIPFEICRFLIGGIGIMLGIPISILLSAVLLKIRRKKL
ncbi:YibE/F family protein [Hespellia stercorisuis]|uniref:Uncharacterized membrane protein n=1 Tax=Hespellia stercorisuis DSM 15480 TaxID=1121950 RepID=A0A1M6L9A9_9FIRM|nr:YibE/F family protein [Hespellia stercorisuis]SHJ67791.1 Uncharacterized membrane protein [Hespellia stercorisuis DSM 15480]